MVEIGGILIIQAVLGGKSLGYEYTEDILTSTVFGTLKYLRPDAVLIPFIEMAFLYDNKRTTLWERLNLEGIELRCYQEVDYVFWAWNQNYGEPDLILLFSNHIHGKEDILIVIEAKFKSGKSGINENDQLARYSEAINKDIEHFSVPSISNFKGKKGFIIYLTQSEAHSDISATSKVIKEKYGEIEESIFHLRWHQLYKTCEKMCEYYSSYEKAIMDDLMRYLEKLGLRDFSGITIPDDSLIKALSLSYPVFFRDSIGKKQKKTYLIS